MNVLYCRFCPTAAFAEIVPAYTAIISKTRGRDQIGQQYLTEFIGPLRPDAVSRGNAVFSQRV